MEKENEALQVMMEMPEERMKEYFKIAVQSNLFNNPNRKAMDIFIELFNGYLKTKKAGKDGYKRISKHGFQMYCLDISSKNWKDLKK